MVGLALFVALWDLLPIRTMGRRQRSSSVNEYGKDCEYDRCCPNAALATRAAASRPGASMGHSDTNADRRIHRAGADTAARFLVAPEGRPDRGRGRHPDDQPVRLDAAGRSA